jgi:aminopeptidase N
MSTNFVGHILSTALNLDAKLSSHPIEVDIPDEEKIDQVRTLLGLTSPV